MFEGGTSISPLLSESDLAEKFARQISSYSVCESIITIFPQTEYYMNGNYPVDFSCGSNLSGRKSDKTFLTPRVVTRL